MARCTSSEATLFSGDGDSSAANSEPCGSAPVPTPDRPRTRWLWWQRRAADAEAATPQATAGATLEKPYRSLIKAISWRATGTLDTMLISFLITGRLKWALSIGFVELFTKVTLYYLHERAWNRISIGRIKTSPHNFEI